jgi:hypothetical protein
MHVLHAVTEPSCCVETHPLLFEGVVGTLELLVVIEKLKVDRLELRQVQRRGRAAMWAACDAACTTPGSARNSLAPGLGR